MQEGPYHVCVSIYVWRIILLWFFMGFRRRICSSFLGVHACWSGCDGICIVFEQRLKLFVWDNAIYFLQCAKKKEFPHKKEPVTVGDSAVVRVVLISSGRSSVGAFLPFLLRLPICADPTANLVIWAARLLNRGHTHQPEDNSLHTLCRPSPWQEHWKFSPGSAPLALDFS